jgi:hypothetical protein
LQHCIVPRKPTATQSSGGAAAAPSQDPRQSRYAQTKTVGFMFGLFKLCRTLLDACTQIASLAAASEACKLGLRAEIGPDHQNSTAQYTAGTYCNLSFQRCQLVVTSHPPIDRTFCQVGQITAHVSIVQTVYNITLAVRFYC